MRHVALFFRLLPFAIGLALVASVFAGCATVAADEKVVAADVEKGLVLVGVRGSTQIGLPGLDAAVAVVWASYGRTDPPPMVLIVQGNELTCTDPASGQLGFQVLLLSGPACRGGYTLLPDRISVAYRAMPWSTSALSHELAHQVLIRSLQGNPIGDPNHLTAAFQLGGAVDQANAALAAKGL